MGYIRHHAIIITYNEDALSYNNMEIPIVKIKEYFGQHNVAVVCSGINSYKTIIIGPDGSKEGWPKSDEGDHRREEFLEWFVKWSKWCDVIEVCYGGDGEESTIRDIYMGVK